MSLQVWLPLNGSLENKGLSDLQFSGLDSISQLTNTNYPGKIGQYAYYNPSYTGGGYISDKKINLGKQNSYACWVNFDSLTSNSSLGGAMGGQHRYPSNCGMGLTIRYVSSSTGYLSCNTGDGTNRTFNTYYGKTLLQADTWYHVCMTYDGQTIRLYVNGTLDNRDGANYTYTAQKNIEDYIFIGAWSSGDSSGNRTLHGNYKLNGCINDFRAYNHCLSPREVKLLAQGLVAHYKLDSGNPNLLNTLSGTREAGYYNYKFDRSGFGRFLTNGETCTLTICFTPTSNFQKFRPHFDNGNIPCTADYPSNYDSSVSNGQRQIVTLACASNYSGSNTPTTTNTVADLRLYVRRNSDGAYDSSVVTVHWVKLQIGAHTNVNTWSPSISEQASYYNTEYDCSGYGNHGSLSSVFEASTDSPRYSYATVFKDNKYINCGRGAMVTDALTISCWARANNWSTFNGQFVSCTDTGGWGLGYGADTDGHGFEVFCNGGYYGINLNYNSLSSGWHHITATYNGNTIIGYIDGQPIASKSGLPGKLTYNSSNCLMIGAEPGGTTPSGNYFTGKISDVRIYATALSAAAVKELYQSSISFLDNGTLQCSEIVESPTNLKYNQNGITQAELISEIGYTNKMKIKTLSDGSAWARIYWLDVSTNATYFANTTQALECTDQANRFSLMKFVDKFKSVSGKYEFMLTYPAISSAYNRWTQTSSPNDSSVTGYSAVGIQAWTAHNAGLRKHGTNCIYNCDSGGTWYAPICQLGHGNWNGAGSMIPAANGTNTSQTELWVRIDNLPKLTKLSMLDDAIQAHQIYEL